MIVIIMSSIALASEDPVDPKSDWNKQLGYFDYGFTCVFGIEVLLKVHNCISYSSANLSLLFYKLVPRPFTKSYVCLSCRLSIMV